MDFSINTRPLLQVSDSDEESVDLRTQSYQESDHDVLINDRKPILRTQEPSDRYNLAYIIFYFLGITSLLPWNFFITADDYWMFKFRNVNYTASDGKRTPLQAEFTSYVSVASSVPNIAFLAINTALIHKVSLNKRVIGSLLSMLILFIVTTVFVKVNTDSYQQAFFGITLTIVALLNIASAILCGSIFGVVGKFSPPYITATVGGQALGGIFAAVAQIAALSVGISPTFSALVYFIVGTLMLFLTLVAYVILSKATFFKYHLLVDKANVIARPNNDHELLRPQIICHRSIFWRIWPQAVSAFLVFAITLSVYPGVTVLIESEDKSSGTPWTNKYFVPVVAYLLFSSGDYVGRLTAGYFQWPRRGSLTIAMNLMRIIFIPLLLVCNAQPRHSTIPVLIDKDYYYILIILLCSLSHGYFANLMSICAPSLVQHHEKETASAMISVFIGLGLGLGSMVSLSIVKLI